MPERWAGIDVGGWGKGFHLAVVDRTGLAGGPTRLQAPDAVVEWLRGEQPRVVAVDSPRVAAPAGERSRACERELVRARVCSLRYTPSDELLQSNRRYYGWVLNGLTLYAALAREAERGRWSVIECFPTAAWTRWGGRRSGAPRAAWSRSVLGSLGLRRLPQRMSQDARDAVGAALTARAHWDGRTQCFGEIVVPLAAE